MKKTLYFAFFFLLSIGSQAQLSSKADFKNFEKYIEETRIKWNIPGIAIAMVKDGETVFAKGFGYANLSTKLEVDAHTIFGIASNSKAFTAAALAVLVDQGKINWDDKVQQYLPWFQLYDPYVSANMTIKDLLSHRSGLKTFSGDLIWYASKHSREEIIRRARFLKPKYGFREQFGYSNILYLTAGQVVHAVTDTTWDDFIQHHFFNPLGMTRSGTSIRKFSEQNNVAAPHNTINKENKVIPYVNWDNIAPAGSINSSVAEMAEWIKLQLARGKYKNKQVFSEKVSYDMWQAITPFYVSKSRENLFPGMHFSAYGLGWNLTNYKGHKIVSHSGGLDGMISRVAMLPEENFGFVILTNNNNGLSTWLMYEIIDRYLKENSKDWPEYALNLYKNTEQQNENITLKTGNPDLPLEKYTGTYGGKVYGNIVVYLDNNKLKVRFEHTPLFDANLSIIDHNIFEIELHKLPALPKGKAQFINNMDGQLIQLKIDIPNPDFDFTELDFFKIN